MRVKRWFTTVILIGLMLNACQSIEAVTPGLHAVGQQAALEPLPRAQQPRADAPTYGVRGPYGVGVRNFVIEAIRTDERTLMASIWYPADNPKVVQEAVVYTTDFPANETSGFLVAGQALANADPARSGAPYPLVIFTHGACAFRQQAIYLVEQLASFGFVVIAVDHEDNWGTRFTPPYQSQVSRPRDMLRQIDFAEQQSAASGVLAKLIDVGHVAVVGYSLGGQIALELGGARLNRMDWHQNFCARYPTASECVVYAPVLEQLNQLAVGFAAMPAEMAPDWRDPRVDVIVALAPNITILSGLNNVRLPLLLIVGSNDGAAGYGPLWQRTFATLTNEHKTRVLFLYAGHTIYFNDCAANPSLATSGFTWVCTDAVWDMNRAHDLINHFATAFLLAELKGDAEAAKTLAPANVTFPGIQYETTGYGE